jgi:hypothetical protein
MKLRNMVIVVATVTMAATIQTVQASYTDNLGDLVNNDGSLTVDNITFSGFSDTPTTLYNYNPADITVTASESDGVAYLTFVGTIEAYGTSVPLAGAGGDLLLGYNVTTTGHTAISSIDQLYTGAAVNGTLLITENVYSPGAPTAQSQLSDGFGPPVINQPNPYPFGLSGPGSLLSIVPPQTTLTVSKDISMTLNGGSSVAEVDISEIQQSWHLVAVPEASTVMAGALLLLPLGASTLRILRRNRMA